jgi:hypothetical protein
VLNGLNESEELTESELTDRELLSEQFGLSFYFSVTTVFSTPLNHSGGPFKLIFGG